MQRAKLIRAIKKVDSDSFEALTLEVFRYQAMHNKLYADFLNLIGKNPENTRSINDIPFLPIQFFKNYEIKTGIWTREALFSSSGTSGTTTSKHHVRNLTFYQNNTIRCFEYFYGPVKNYCVLALLPSYLERSGSSLVYMAAHFIRQSKYKESGFFLNEHEKLIKSLIYCKKNKIPVLLIGVSFALLDLAEKYKIDLNGQTVMETGGMKGRRKEMVREALHGILKGAFDLPSVHSEYGMTELLSQAYSKGDGIFYPAPPLRILTREINDFNCLQKAGKTGAINVIDLANIDTISFIATDDLGKTFEDDSFEILGRMDASDLRGCNLMVGDKAF